MSVTARVSTIGRASEGEADELSEDEVEGDADGDSEEEGDCEGEALDDSDGLFEEDGD